MLHEFQRTCPANIVLQSSIHLSRMVLFLVKINSEIVLYPSPCKQVHCVYGQSRSAAVIVSYLLSEGVQIDDAVQLIKKRRPVTCINPGFLAQLFLLSKKNSHSAQIQLVVRGIFKCRGMNTLKTDTIGSIEKCSEAVTLEYIDCYKPVLISSNDHQCGFDSGVNDSSRDHIKCDARIDRSISEKDHNALGHEHLQRQGQDTILTVHDGISGMMNIPRQIDTTDSVVCGKCGHVLACDSDIVRAIDYSEFLSSTTDDYWMGYTAIHPSGGRAIRLENCNKLKRKGENLNGKSVVIAASKKRSDESKSNIMLKDSREQQSADEIDLDIQDLVILGPMGWILSQMAKDGDDECNAKTDAAVEGGDAGSGSDPVKNPSSQCKMGRHDTSSIRCPNCKQICGFYKESGLDLCNSFIRCELFALRRSKIVVKVIKSLPLTADNS